MSTLIRRFTQPIGAAIRRVRSTLPGDRRGNVFMIFGFAVIPITFATGMSIDYGQAMRLQTKLNAAADAAALAATSQTEMDETIAHATARAKTLFRTQVSGTAGLKTMDFDNSSQLSITIAETTTATGLSRTATVRYAGESINSFAGILGMPTLTIKGSSQALASTAPNIDFYMLLDISSSMALPTTSAGITLLQQKANGCAFACHATNDEKAWNKDRTAMVDYYGVAKSWGIPLRVEAETMATQSLMTVATSTSQNNGATYRMSISTFSEKDSFDNIVALTTNLTAAGTTASNVQIPTYYTNNCPERYRCNNDQDTAQSYAFGEINRLMPNPGNGTKATSDRPQQIMFVITDGARDEFRPGGKPELEFDTSQCTTIKNRGIRIAILYTEYLSAVLDGNAWSTQSNQGDVKNRLYKIEPALRTCASDGLFYKVTTDGDISAALNSLFMQAVSTSHLTR